METDRRRQLEQEEDDIEQAWERGEISDAERNAEARELERDYRHAAREAAEDAYHEEWERW